MAIERAWVTGEIGRVDASLPDGRAAPLVCVRRMAGDDAWEVYLVSADSATRCGFRAWIGLLPPLHAGYDQTRRVWWVSAHGMWRLTQGKHPFAVLLADAKRAIVANASGEGR